ncbi:hypothetical protein BHYA_0028g00190 [Botrytis hyacinthi]|uniref:Uncharacterized protein n=1 Tax=Botrytis hyacinthi TaxID=278943 RepID=A0A4Z1GWX0_9HELO|nr:hypothetical protein BHYA_0028g00190 [Botrytis hyacinthi]
MTLLKKKRSWNDFPLQTASIFNVYGLRSSHRHYIDKCYRFTRFLSNLILIQAFVSIDLSQSIQHLYIGNRFGHHKMCNTVLVKGPCWCNGNNGKRVTVGESVKTCKYVLRGGSHDEYEPRFREIETVEGNCDKCPHLEAEAHRLETEALEREWMETGRAEARKVEAQRVEAERVEAQRVAEEQAAQVAAQGGYQGDYQGGHEGVYQGGNQGSYQDSHRSQPRRVHRGRNR